MLNVRRTTITVAGLLIAAAAVVACDPVATTTTTTTSSASSPVKPASGASVQASQPAAAPPAPDAKDAKSDVEIKSCEVDGTLNWPSAGLTITNHSSKSSNYIINIEFVDAGGTRLAEGIAATNNLAAGQAANVKAQGTGEVKGKISCRVVDVTRYASQ